MPIVFKTANPTAQSDSVNSVAQIIKLFLPTDYSISPGSKIVVTQNGVTTEYKNAGKPFIYDSHQEIEVELFEGGHNEL